MLLKRQDWTLSEREFRMVRSFFMALFIRYSAVSLRVEGAATPPV